MLANARATRRCRLTPTCFAAALALLFALENNFGSSKAAATAGLSVAKTATDESDKLESGAHTCSGCATSCAGVKRLHQRYQRFFPNKAEDNCKNITRRNR